MAIGYNIVLQYIFDMEMWGGAIVLVDRVVSIFKKEDRISWVQTPQPPQ